VRAIAATRTALVKHKVAHPTGYATRWKQVNNEEMEEVFGSRQELLALKIGSEGR
jgi:hypothetical protein